MSWFSAPTAEWFANSFAGPTPAQRGAWDAISRGDNTLVVAPTGSGKTLSAFLWAIDQLSQIPRDKRDNTSILYISPLKALGVDVERNLRSPLVGIKHAATRLGLPEPEITVGVRSGDTPQAERRALISKPPDILITTPESLFLMLTSAAKSALTSINTVIIDEIHAVAGTKRGTHLALSLERLDDLVKSPAQRIGLSATVNPIEEIAKFLSPARPATIVAPKADKKFDISVRVPVDDMANVESMWPHVEQSIFDLITKHSNTIVFVNSRRTAERLTARLNELFAESLGEDTTPAHNPKVPGGAPAFVMASGSSSGASPRLARAHHGSVSKEQRAEIEDDLKTGRLRCVVATSSLELGIDMGAVDVVIQVQSPPSAAAGLQRVGRAGHQVGEASRGVFFPQHRVDLLHSAVTVRRMLDGVIEPVRIPTNPLDILAQQTIAAASQGEITVDEWFATVTRSYPYISLPRSAFDAVLDLVSGKYPSDEFGELRPRVIYDRVAGTITGRPGAQRLAVTSGGTIPDRGMFSVYLVGGDTDAKRGSQRVGELDEEMVYETRIGDVISLGATSWQVEDITHDRVLVLPAFGQPGRLPFWTGENEGRPIELGRAMGAFLRQPQQFEASPLDEQAQTNLTQLLTEQRDATGLPTDKTLIIERFRDELGDWRILLHSTLGLRVHAPWAIAINARISARYGISGAAVAQDDGIIVRLPDTDDEPPGLALFTFDADDIEREVISRLGDSALFASRFRECAARALLLPKRNPGRRAPLWQQRQRSQQLLEVARKYPTFPIVLETMRECVQDVYDVPSLIEIMTSLDSRTLRVTEVETSKPSPFASNLLFNYVGGFMYEGDVPLAERRSAALSLDVGLLGELLGTIDVAELLDPDITADVERNLQWLSPDRQAKDSEGIFDALRALGPMTREELRARYRGEDLDTDITSLGTRIISANIGGAPHFAVAEDAGRLRDGLGVPLPIGVAESLLDPVIDPLGDLLSRYARTHGPFSANDVATRFHLGVAVVTDQLMKLTAQQRLVEISPGWCDAQVLKRIRMMSLSALRADVEPVNRDQFARFLPVWQGLSSSTVIDVVDQLAGYPIPASMLESNILPARVPGYHSGMLDELTASGDVVWSGVGEIGSSDGWICLHPSDIANHTLHSPADIELTDEHLRVLEVVGGGGGYFFRQIANDTGINDSQLQRIMWQLVWSGRLTNDSLAPVRLLAGPKVRAPQRFSRRPSRSARVARSGGNIMPGRWSALTIPDVDATSRAVTWAEVLLDRYGVVTKGSVVNEAIAGGFSSMYKVLNGFEESGKARRGYFVESLGASQFAYASTVDSLRADIDDRAYVLAAIDPAQPYGAALSWPDVEVERETGHRPGRKPGALVVLVGGSLVLYIERGMKSILTFTSNRDVLSSAATAFADYVARGRNSVLIEKVNGHPVAGSTIADELKGAGFSAVPRGYRMRPRA